LHNVKLDWITPDAQRVIARHARVSAKNPDKDEFTKLLNYCIRHGHWSVFEQASASFEIITSRAISAQIMRHKSFNFQETSQRYCDPLDVLEEEDEICWDFDLRRQDIKNRQNSTADLDIEIAAKFKQRIYDTYWEIKKLYKDMLEAGVAKECARNILPMCAPTKIYMTGSIRSFLHYVGLRASIETQTEHRLVAKQIAHSLENCIPVIAEAVKLAAENDRGLRGWLNT
jgi:thymidylate synthase (FAD)